MATLKKRSVLDQRIAELQDQIARLERFGDDDHEDGAVLMFDAPGLLRYQGHARLTYVALKKGGKWWVSNGQNRPYSWVELVGMMSESPDVWLASEWEQV